jgi:hypothetical protein
LQAEQATSDLHQEVVEAVDYRGGRGGRRSATSAAGPSTQIKQEKAVVKTAKVKQEKVNGKRRPQTPEAERDLSEHQKD